MNEDLIKKKVQPLSPSSDLKSRDRKLKTTLMLSAITCIFMCVLGYEMVHEEPHDTRLQNAKRLEIVNTASRHQGFNTDQRQLALLNAQNQHLAHKILSLKEEAKSAAERLHLMQTSILAAQRKIESDKVIALRAEISEKEQNQQKLQSTIAQLEGDIADYKEQILAMEASFATFQEMIELHKKSKDELIANYKSKIDEMQTIAKHEKDLILSAVEDEKMQLHARLNELEASKTREAERLTNIVLDLEENQKFLKLEAARQAEEMVFLEDEINKYSLIAIEKDEAVDVLQADQSEAKRQLQDLAAFVQVEHLIAEQKERELLYLSSSHAAKQEEVLQLQQTLSASARHAAEIEDLLNARTAELALHEESLKSLQLAKELTEKEYETQIAELREALEIEKQGYLVSLGEQERQITVLESLQNSLNQQIIDKDTAFAELAEESQTHQLALIALKSELESKTAAIEYLQTELDLLANDANRSKLIHESSEQALADELENTRSAYQDLAKDLSRLAEEKSTLQEKLLESTGARDVLERQIAQYQRDLIAKSDEVEKLKRSFDFSEQEVLSLKEALNEEQARSALQMEIQDSAIAALHIQLESIIGQNELANAKNTSLENELSALQRSIEEQAAAYRLTQESDNRSEIIATQATQIEENQAIIAKIQTDYEAERQNTTELEKQIAALKTNLSDYENRLKSQLEQSEQALENQRLELDILDKSLIASQTRYNEATRRADTLENELTALRQLANERELALAEVKALNQRLDQELSTYQNSLESTLAAYEIEQNKVQSYELRLDEMSAFLSAQQETLNAKSAEATALLTELENAKNSSVEQLSKQYSELAELNKKYELEQIKARELEVRLAELASIVKENAQELARKNEESMLQRLENEKISQELAEAFAVREESSLRSSTLESKLEELSGLIAMREQAIAELAATSKGQMDEMSRQSFELADALSRYEFEQAKTRELERQLSDLSVAIHLKEQEVGQSKEYSASQREINEALTLELTRHRNALSEALAKYEIAEENLLKHEEILKSLEQQLSEKDRTIEEKESILSSRTTLANELMEAIASLHESRAKLQKELERARGDFAKLLGIPSFPPALPLHNLEGVSSIPK